MAKKKNTLNRVYKGKKKGEGGTLSIQMEQYEGFKYIKKILQFFQENEGQHQFSELREYFEMRQDEYVPDIVFVQTRILKLAKEASKIDDREYELGEFGNFLKDNYISENPKALLLSAFLVYSVVPYIIYDIYQALNKKFIRKNFKGKTYSKFNNAKKEAFLELLGIHSKGSHHIYDTIPLFALKTKKVGKSNINILRQDKPSIIDKAGIISLNFVLSDTYKNIRKIYERQNKRIPYIKLEDLYFYLVRPKILIENYDLYTFLDDLYPYSGIFYFLRSSDKSSNENFEFDDIYWFLQTFEDVQVKCIDLFKVDPILDLKIVDNLRIPELNYRITLIGEDLISY